MQRIQRLDPAVVNKIAAGEIIVQPANALKEMLENSIDAGASVVDIIVKDGGTKLLQLTDNGHGIAKDDLALLCERFATSKLRSFDDLRQLGTYGFRGEALASISHIARVSVVTKTDGSPVAYKAFYVDGRLTGPNFKPGDVAVKPVAGKNGTQITVEDLFYNIPARLKSLRSKNDEFVRILDVVGRYAVHTQGVGFSCKKLGESHQTLLTRPNLPLKERVRIVFGSEAANELLDVLVDGSDTSNGPSLQEKYGLRKVSGAITNSNYSSKKSAQTVFFINNRLVSCDPLRRAILATYQFFLPRGASPFIYISLDLDPHILDVNIHPTKREVRFLHEDEIIDAVKNKVHDLLSSVDASRKFKAQGLLGSLKRDSEIYEQSQAKKSRQENKLVRVDASQSKLNPFLKPQSGPQQKDSLTKISQDAELVSADEVHESFVHDASDTNEASGSSSPEIVSQEVQKPSDEPQEPDELFVEESGSESEKPSQPAKTIQNLRRAFEGENSPQVRKRTIDDNLERELEVSISDDESSNPPASNNRSTLGTKSGSRPEILDDIPIPEVYAVDITSKEFTKVSLISIKDIKQEFTESVDKNICRVFQKCSYIGLMDETKRLCCFQSDVNLFLCDYGTVLFDFYYQLALQEFCNYGQYTLSEPMAVSEILEPLYEHNSELAPKEQICETLMGMIEMFEEYFGIIIEENQGQLWLRTLPMIAREIKPNLDKLPFFIYRLGTKINYEDEKQCLDGIMKQIALFYVPESVSSDDDKRKQVDELLDNRIFPMLRQRYLATTRSKDAVIQIADLPGLYKIFERC